MLGITDKTTSNRFKGLVLMVSASHTATGGLSLDGTAALLRQHRERERSVMKGVTLLWCLAPGSFLFPHDRAFPRWITLLTTYGTRSCATTGPVSFAGYWLWSAGDGDGLWCAAFGTRPYEVAFPYLQKCDIAAGRRGHGNRFLTRQFPSSADSEYE